VTETEVRHIDITTAERTLAPAVFNALVRTTNQVRVTLRRIRAPKPIKASKPWRGWTGRRKR
jgi:hypothetical protein